MTRTDQHTDVTTEPLEHASADRSAPGHPAAGNRAAGRFQSKARCTPQRHLEHLVRLAHLVVVVMLGAMALSVVSPTGAFGAVSASPVAPPGATGLQDLLNWTLYGGAIACAATAMFGFAKMGISHTQQSYQGANHGKSVAILGLLGALGLGLTPTIVNGLTQIH